MGFPTEKTLYAKSAN
ncbi:hypothetical protein FG05_35363 [Fusarium graminearum]|nr:hypothetical protein FG05_35363 [Fusarium graminearum]